MAKYLRYMGEFLSRAGVAWRVEILQDAEQPFATVGSLEFDANEALVIEWGETSKENVLCGSSASLNIISPGDRTYEDLYTITPGRIRMDVYRNGALYWSGTLDPEFYEEPYERAANYNVSLTFSDFGILGRVKYDLGGLRSVYDIVQLCIAKSGINAGLDKELISTSLTPDGAKIDLSEILVDSGNFYDEDGEASTLDEVLEGVLQPLALKVVQMSGCVRIYDLNALFSSAGHREVEWSGDSQTMGVDKVYNNVKVTWSPYTRKDTMTHTDCWELSVDPDAIDLYKENGTPKGESVLFTYRLGSLPRDWINGNYPGFTLWVSETGKNAEIVHPQARFCKMVPQFNGQEKEGIAVMWPYMRLKRFDTWAAATVAYVDHVNHGLPPKEVFVGPSRDESSAGGTIFRTHSVDIPVDDNPEQRLIKINMEMLADYKFNPFEDDYNLVSTEDGLDMAGIFQPVSKWKRHWRDNGNFLYVPVAVRFQPHGSDKVYIWSNENVTRNRTEAVKDLNSSYGWWVPEDNPRVHVIGHLCYYDPDGRSDKPAAGGWMTNRQAINPHWDSLGYTMKNAGNGQFIPYPPVGKTGGRLWVEVLYGGWYAAKGAPAERPAKIYYNLRNYVTWIVCQPPEIVICNKSWAARDIADDDVEYSAELNAEAKEDLSIDTICGTSASGVPTARGAYIDASTGRQIRQMSRAGRTTQVEDLLIGTVFSQYARRHTSLSGEMTMNAGGLAVYTEANQGEKVFYLAGDVQNPIMDVSDATLIELSPDEYKKDNE